MKQKLFKSCDFILNRECNLDCTFCNVNKIETENAPFRDVIKGLEIMHKLSDFIVIIGGEPLLYDNILEVVNTLDSLGAEFTMVTNGTLLTDEMAKNLKNAGLKNITISIDSYKGFDVEKIKNIKDYFEDVSVNIVYDGKLVGSLFNLIKYLTNYDIWSIIALYNYSIDEYRIHYFVSEKDDEYIIQDFQVNIMKNDINRIISEFDNLLIHNTKDYIENIPVYFDKLNWHCSYPYRLVVNNDLKIMPCEDMEPFDFNIFQLEESINRPELFGGFVSIFKEKIKTCKGCYLCAYYDLERLTPLEITHKGGKNVSYGNTGLSLCYRGSNREVGLDEEHICWFCGNPIKISSSFKSHCRKCGLMKCTHCGKCFCDGTEEEKEFLIYINKEYCCNEKNLKEFNKKDFYDWMMWDFPSMNINMIDNAYKCLKVCSDLTNKNILK